MTSLNVSEARAGLYRRVDEAAESHESITIKGRRSKAVLVAEEDWWAIQETLHLLSIPGMPESIREGLAMPVDACSPEAGW